MSLARWYTGDTRAVLAQLEPGSVDLILSSPPFLALRSYLPADHPDKANEIGSEPTPGEFLDTILDVVEACARVLAPHGSLVFEFGDTYAGSGGRGEASLTGTAFPWRETGWQSEARDGAGHRIAHGTGWPLDKSLTLIPESFAWALAYGRNPWTGRETEPWRIRNYCPWVRPNPPVGALCVDDQTEALTPDGWKRHDQLTDGDLIAAYDPARDSCRFVPAKFVRYEREGEPMVAVEKRSTSQRMTLDHRAWTRTRKTEPHVRLARDLTNDCDTLLSAPLDDVPGPAPVTTERAALLGWFVAEGTPHHRQARIVQSATANPEKVARIRALLDRDGADYRETTYRHPGGSDVVTFHVKGELAEWLNLHHKRLPMAYVTTWPEQQARALFDALIDGDGHRRKSGRGNGLLFHQQDQAIADAVQVLAMRFGYRATKTYQPSMRLWQVTMGTNRWTRVRKWDGTGIPTETYTGTVWCPMVETGLWLARRNGRPFVTGNSDKFRPATSYLTVATKARDRWFDLDAVRVPYSANSHARVPKGAGPRDNDVKVSPDGNRDTLAIKNNDGAGAPPLDWFLIPTQPYPGQHYATWPQKLALPFIEAMCPRQVCRECGEPRRRLVETSYEPNRNTNGPQSIERKHLDGGSAGYAQRADRVAETVGWSDCSHDSWRNGIVLDPFAGSGTTLQVATGCGRDAIGIDLDKRNADLARERIGMFLDIAEQPAQVDSTLLGGP